MNKEEAIQKAKDLCKLDYESTMKRLGCGNPTYKRNWIRYNLPGGVYCFAYEGTPDKAFVYVYPEKKLVIACRRSKEKIKEFAYEGD
jgi:hypothetical protein